MDFLLFNHYFSCEARVSVNDASGSPFHHIHGSCLLGDTSPEFVGLRSGDLELLGPTCIACQCVTAASCKTNDFLRHKSGVQTEK